MQRVILGNRVKLSFKFLYSYLRTTVVTTKKNEMAVVQYCGIVVLLFALLCYDHVADAGLDSGSCIMACSKTFVLANKLTCYRCSKNPPVDRAMCQFACKFTSWNPWALTDICEACFMQKRQMMSFICKGECVPVGYDEENELCFACKHQLKSVAAM